MEIEGQAAIVSGGASGLGRATAETLSAAEVRVTLLDINEAAAAAVAREIGGFAIGCDVTDAAAVEAAVAAARQRHGRADCRARRSAAPRCVSPRHRGRSDLCRNQMINGEVIRLDGALRMAPR